MPLSESKPAVTLDQLIALNDEIASLVRAGVPLEQGLSDLGQDLPGRLGKFAARLAEQTGRGESLVDALGAGPDFRGDAGPGQSGDSTRRETGTGRSGPGPFGVPRVYRAVVEAGVRAGRLPAALESLAGSMRRLAETRRGVILALLYPLLLMTIAWGMFALFTAFLAPQLLQTFSSLGLRAAVVLQPLVWLGRGAKYWGPIGPAALLLMAVLWWRTTTRATVIGSGRAVRLFGWLPWLRRTLRLSHAAVFVDILAMLVENCVPLDEALRLAGAASGDPRLAGGADDLADTIRRGGKVAGTLRVPSAESVRLSGREGTGPFFGQPTQPQDATLSENMDLSPFPRPDLEKSPADGTPTNASRRCPVPATLPPLLHWLILGGRSQAALLPALRHTAENYHAQAQFQAELARTWLPILFTLFVSSTITLLYTLSLFVPYTSMLKELARP